jgi:hypothetical protein
LTSTAYTPYSPLPRARVVAPPASSRASGLLSGPAPRNGDFVRSIGSTTIVPRAPADLPGIAPALRDPSRYAIANHNGQGHMVLDVQQGGVRFVTGNDYLSISEQSRRAAHQGQAAAWRAEMADAAGEALISISLAHETARDFGVLATGKDYYNPRERFDANQRAMAGLFLVVPEGNSGQVRKAQKLLDASSMARRTNAELVQEVATRADAKIGGTGRLAGTAKHVYSRDVLDRYQRMFGDRGLSTEIRYVNQAPWLGGTGTSTKGSVILDVVEGPVGNPSAIYDYKFGAAGLVPSRVNQMRGVTGFQNTPIIEVRP